MFRRHGGRTEEKLAGKGREQEYSLIGMRVIGRCCCSSSSSIRAELLAAKGSDVCAAVGAHAAFVCHSQPSQPQPQQPQQPQQSPVQPQHETLRCRLGQPPLQRLQRLLGILRSNDSTAPQHQISKKTQLQAPSNKKTKHNSPPTPPHHANASAKQYISWLHPLAFLSPPFAMHVICLVSNDGRKQQYIPQAQQKSGGTKWNKS